MQQIEKRKRQLATPGFREREEKEQRAAAAAAKAKGTKFPELVNRGTKPVLTRNAGPVCPAESHFIRNWKRKIDLLEKL